MDAEELKVVLDELRDVRENQLIRATNEGFEAAQQRGVSVCIAHGGHEYDDFGHQKACKFCGHVKVL